MSGQKRQRDAAVELARLLACLIVIGVHVALPTRIDGVWDASRTAIATWVADGVAVFWLISGAFLFSSKSYEKVLRRTAKSVLVPLMLWSLLWFFLGDFIMGRAGIVDSIAHSHQEFRDFLASICIWRNPLYEWGHLWYLYVYVLVMVCFPVLRAFVEYLDSDTRRENVFLAIALGLLCVNDIGGNAFMSFSHVGLNGLVPACLLVVIGHIVYRHREMFRRPQTLYIAPLAFFALNGVRLWTQVRRGAMGWDNDYILFWFSALGVLCAISILAFCIALVDRDDASIAGRAIRSLAGYTFTVYIIHIAVRDRIWFGMLYGPIERMTVGALPGFVGELLYTVTGVVVIFAISVAIVAVLRKVKELIRRAYGNMSERWGN